MREAHVVRLRRFRNVPGILLKGVLPYEPASTPARPADPIRKCRLDYEMVAPQRHAYGEGPHKGLVFNQRDEEQRLTSSVGPAEQRVSLGLVVLARVQDAVMGFVALPRGVVVTDLVE